MSLADDLRLIAQSVRGIPDVLGFESTTVTIRKERWDRPMQDGAVTQGPIDVVVTPSPEVEKLSAAAASFYGGGPLATATGRTMVNVYKVGPLTQRTTAGGGYLAEDFLIQLADGTITRAVVALIGPNQVAGVPEICEVCDVKAIGPVDVFVWVRTAPVIT